MWRKQFFLQVFGQGCFATELAERGRAQSMLPAMSLHTTFRRKSKHWGIFHHVVRL